LPHLGLPRATEVELWLDRLEQPLPFGLRHTEQDADHLHGQLSDDVDQKVERHPGFDVIEQCPSAHPHVEHLTRDGQVMQPAFRRMDGRRR
jgi:hypothetical protein